MDFITALEKEFIAQANTAQSMAMQAYMKNHFPFFVTESFVLGLVMD